MRQVAVMAAVMPGLGDPRLMAIDDFLAFQRTVSYAAAISSGRPMTDRQMVELGAD